MKSGSCFARVYLKRNGQKHLLLISAEIANTLFNESQGIADIAIKLHKMVQWGQSLGVETKLSHLI